MVDTWGEVPHELTKMLRIFLHFDTCHFLNWVEKMTDISQQLSVQLVFVCLWFDYGYDIHVLKVNYAMYFPSYLSSITSDPLPSCVDCWFKGVSFMQELQTHKVRQMENITPIPIGIHNLSWMSAETVNVYRKFQKY